MSFGNVGVIAFPVGLIDMYIYVWMFCVLVVNRPECVKFPYITL